LKDSSTTTCRGEIVPCEERRCLPSMTEPTGHERSGRAPVSDRSSLSLRVAHSRIRDTPAIRRIRRKTAQAEEIFSSAYLISRFPTYPVRTSSPLATHRRVVRYGDKYSASRRHRVCAPGGSRKKVPANPPTGSAEGSTEHWPCFCRTGCEAAYHHSRGVCHG
jgi:hypothetical protein